MTAYLKGYTIRQKLPDIPDKVCGNSEPVDECCGPRKFVLKKLEYFHPKYSD
jgi:hypothetical protein